MEVSGLSVACEGGTGETRDSMVKITGTDAEFERALGTCPACGRPVCPHCGRPMPATKVEYPVVPWPEGPRWVWPVVTWC